MEQHLLAISLMGLLLLTRLAFIRSDFAAIGLRIAAGVTRDPARARLIARVVLMLADLVSVWVIASYAFAFLESYWRLALLLLLAVIPFQIHSWRRDDPARIAAEAPVRRAAWLAGGRA